MLIKAIVVPAPEVLLSQTGSSFLWTANCLAHRKCVPGVHVNTVFLQSCCVLFDMRDHTALRCLNHLIKMLHFLKDQLSWISPCALWRITNDSVPFLCLYVKPTDNLHFQWILNVFFSQDTNQETNNCQNRSYSVYSTGKKKLLPQDAQGFLRLKNTDINDIKWIW